MGGRPDTDEPLAVRRLSTPDSPTHERPLLALPWPPAHTSSSTVVATDWPRPALSLGIDGALPISGSCSQTRNRRRASSLFIEVSGVGGVVGEVDAEDEWAVRTDG